MHCRIVCVGRFRIASEGEPAAALRSTLLGLLGYCFFGRGSWGELREPLSTFGRLGGGILVWGVLFVAFGLGGVIGREGSGVRSWWVLRGRCGRRGEPFGVKDACNLGATRGRLQVGQF